MQRSMCDDITIYLTASALKDCVSHEWLLLRETFNSEGEVCGTHSWKGLKQMRVVVTKLGARGIDCSDV